MNLVEARVEDGHVTFGSNRLPLPNTADLGNYSGKAIVLGIRPSDFEDADLGRQPELPTLEAVVDVTEELGSEVNIIFTVDAPPVVSEDIKAAADQEDDDDATLVHDDHVQKSAFTARLDAATKARVGERVRLSVDNTAFHFFDKDTGRAIGERQPVAASA
jgi:multiple sugar transport system ATP-binding protein